VAATFHGILGINLDLFRPYAILSIGDGDRFDPHLPIPILPSRLGLVTVADGGAPSSIRLPGGATDGTASLPTRNTPFARDLCVFGSVICLI